MIHTNLPGCNKLENFTLSEHLPFMVCVPLSPNLDTVHSLARHATVSFTLVYPVFFPKQTRTGESKGQWECRPQRVGMFSQPHLWAVSVPALQTLRDQTKRAGEEAVIDQSLERVISPLQEGKNGSMMSRYSRTRNSFIVILGKFLFVLWNGDNSS